MKKKKKFRKQIQVKFHNILILIYKVISFFLSVAKDLANHLTDIVLLYSEDSYLSGDGFRLFYFYKKSGQVWF